MNGRSRGLSALALATFLATTANAADYTSELTATTEQEVPETSVERLKANGENRAVEDGDQHEVMFAGHNFVPDGLYTFWWVNPGLVGMDMGPGGGLPDNEFQADGDGNAEVTIEVPADNDYQRMVIVYHADDETHGDEPGEMGEISFDHLTGPWPGPAGADEM